MSYSFYPRKAKLSDAGFTLAEALVVVSILGIVSAIAIPSFSFVLRRERVNAIALEAAGWLEEARSQSAREVNQGLLEPGDDDSSQGGCAIVIGGRKDDAKSGDILATIEGSSSTQCKVRQKSLIVPDTQGSIFKIRILGLGNGAGAKDVGDPLNPCKSTMGMVCLGSVSLFFTPRGMWDSSSFEAGKDLEIRIAHADGNGPKRCVRISSLLGSIDIGSASDGNVDAECTKWGAI